MAQSYWVQLPLEMMFQQLYALYGIAYTDLEACGPCASGLLMQTAVGTLHIAVAKCCWQGGWNRSGWGLGRAVAFSRARECGAGNFHQMLLLLVPHYISLLVSLDLHHQKSWFNVQRDLLAEKGLSEGMRKYFFIIHTSQSHPPPGSMQPNLMQLHAMLWKWIGLWVEQHISDSSVWVTIKSHIMYLSFFYHYVGTIWIFCLWHLSGCRWYFYWIWGC